MHKFYIEEFTFHEGQTLTHYDQVLTWCLANGYQFMFFFEVNEQRVVGFRVVVE